MTQRHKEAPETGLRSFSVSDVVNTKYYKQRLDEVLIPGTLSLYPQNYRAWLNRIAVLPERSIWFQSNNRSP